jgi:hypothetical protein
VPGDAREEIVERSDRAASKAPDAGEQIVFDDLYVRADRDNEERIAINDSQIPLEQERNFPRVRGPDNEV